ncbi:MAG TPA: isochorismatase family cysteine hydrolase [Stellaceae bacterium]|jgi:nicotinamidase-related amidase|nr:isochorismatase family cysteine hydrolase [Stellaceae bacterium]
MDLTPFPVEKEAQIPQKLEDFLRRGRVGLLMWDMQNGLAGKALHVDTIKERASRLLASAEKAQVPVFWSRHVLPSLDKIPGPFLLFLMKKQKVSRPSELRPTMQDGMEETKFLDGFAPKPHHIVLEKSQPSLFVDTPLAVRMRTLGLDTLVIAGVATDIGVEFNCRHAAALGFYTVVAEDATGAYTDEAHQRSLAFLRGWTTPVVPTDTICATWDAAR